MKKGIFFGFIALLLALGASAQHTTPRVGTGYQYDMRNLLYKYYTKTDAASSTIDTFSMAPHDFENVYRVVLVDSVCAGNPTVTNCYAGDKLTFILSAASGTPIMKFVGTNWISAGTVTMTTRLRSIVNFVFDGAKWVESGRYTQ